MPNYRHTKLIATLGPATDSREMLAELIVGGVDVVRLNMAHATPDWCRERIARIREVSAEVGRQVAVMMDVKGPEIRTGPVKEPLVLCPGERFELYVPSASPPQDGAGIDVSYAELPASVEVDNLVLVDSGLIRMKVLSKTDERVICEIVVGGELGSRRHINLPGVKVNLPALTEKDKVDLAAGVDAGIDFVALSFVRDCSDIVQLREYLGALESRARIVAKIEDQSGVENIVSIVEETDAVMVARGDLGIEIDYHRLPLVQREIVGACRREGKPVIIATHLLESMIDHPVPTRAEISDVSNAIREQVDAVMLSGETTTGKFPLESIDVLKNILGTNEPAVPNQLNTDILLRAPKSKMLRSAVVLAQEIGEDSGIVVFTRSGFLGYVLAAIRGRGVPIFAFTDDAVVFRQLLLPWGVEPFLMGFSDSDPEQTIVSALGELKTKGWREPGATLVVITNVLAGERTIDSLQMRTIE